MEKIKVGDFVLDPKENKIHTVNDCEIIDGVDILYTQDKKCFPSDKVSFISERNMSTIVEKIIDSKDISENENQCLSTFIKDNIHLFLVVKPATEEELWRMAYSLE